MFSTNTLTDICLISFFKQVYHTSFFSKRLFYANIPPNIPLPAQINIDVTTVVPNATTDSVTTSDNKNKITK